MVAWDRRAWSGLPVVSGLRGLLRLLRTICRGGGPAGARRPAANKQSESATKQASDRVFLERTKTAAAGRVWDQPQRAVWVNQHARLLLSWLFWKHVHGVSMFMSTSAYGLIAQEPSLAKNSSPTRLQKLALDSRRPGGARKMA